MYPYYILPRSCSVTKSKMSLQSKSSHLSLPKINSLVADVHLNGRPAVWIAAFLSALAGLGHFYAIPEHGETLLLAVFFGAVGLLQLGFGGLVLFLKSRRLYAVGIASSTVLIGLYVASRLVAIPLAHERPESIEPLGLLVKLAEVGFAISLFYMSAGSKIGNAGGSGTARKSAAVLIGIGLLIGTVFGFFVAQPQFTQILPKAPLAIGQNVREVTLIIEPKQMNVAGKTWEVWTYNGTVPAPTITGKVGDILRIKLINKHNLVHSIHTHLRGYKFEMDGSQANVIAGKGAGSMVPPGGQFVYEYPLTTPSLYYFHCHSSDGGRTIAEHIRMGLYGAIIVDEPDRAPAMEFVLFYAEGQPGSPAPLVINNRGIPGGEMTLERIFKEQGFNGVAAQLNVTVTAIKVKKDDVVRLHIVNIGDLVHSHHHHGFEHRSVRSLRGDAWAAALLPLVPGQADTLEFRAVESGLWLIHCHVVNHADAGMIAVLIVE